MTDGWRQGLMSAPGPTAAVGLALAFVLGWWLLPTPELRFWGFAAVSALTAAAVTAEMALALGRLDAERVALLLSPPLLVLSAAAWLSLSDSLAGKIAAYSVGVLTVSSFQSHLLPLGRPESGTGGRLTESGPELPNPAGTAGFLDGRPGLVQVSFVSDLFSSFFLAAFVFGLGGFFDVPMLTTSSAVGAIWGFAALVNFRRFGFPRQDRLPLAAVFALSGLEIGLGLAFLPVAHLTKAAVAVLIMAFGIHLTHQVVMGTAETRRFRKSVVLLLVLVALLLATARWS